MNKLLKPQLNSGKYVFVQLKSISEINKDEANIIDLIFQKHQVFYLKNDPSQISYN